MPLQLPLKKPGQTGTKLSLPLTKTGLYIFELFWDSAHDLDAHALLATNDGANGAKVSDFAQVLSTYNSKKTNPNGTLTANPDGSFSTPCGALTHSGDSRTGIGKAIDEIIKLDTTKVDPSVNEIPIFVTIHGNGHTFSQVAKAGIRIKDDSGKEIQSYELTQEFGAFNAVQMGSLVRGDSGWSFHAAGSGFQGDFNTVLGHFS